MRTMQEAFRDSFPGPDVQDVSPLIADVIRRRKARGWSQGELARRCGMLRQQLNAIEVGHVRSPGLDILVRLADALDCAILLTERP
jgi:transcriptional regulator with XRE-family HTH domain